MKMYGHTVSVTSHGASWLLSDLLLLLLARHVYFTATVSHCTDDIDSTAIHTHTAYSSATRVDYEVLGHINRSERTRVSDNISVNSGVDGEVHRS